MGTHPIFESDFDCLTEAGFKTTSPWAECTHQERVSPDPPSLTDDLSHPGRRPPPRKSRTSLPSSPRRVTSLLSSVFTSETPTVLASPTTSPDPKSSESSSPWALLLNSQRISTS